MEFSEEECCILINDIRNKGYWVGYLDQPAKVLYSIFLKCMKNVFYNDYLPIIIKHYPEIERQKYIQYYESLYKLASGEISFEEVPMYIGLIDYLREPYYEDIFKSVIKWRLKIGR